MILETPVKSERRVGLTGRVVPAAQLGAAEGATWEAIRGASRSLASPFFSWRYTRVVAAVRPQVYVCVIMRGAQIVAFLPFQFQSPLHRALGNAERVGEEMTD